MNLKKYQTAIALWQCKFHKQIGYPSLSYGTYVPIYSQELRFKEHQIKKFPVAEAIQ